MSRSLTRTNLEMKSETRSEIMVEKTEKFEISIGSKQKGAFMMNSVNIEPMPTVPKTNTKFAKTMRRSTNVCLRIFGSCVVVATAADLFSRSRSFSLPLLSISF